MYFSDPTLNKRRSWSVFLGTTRNEVVSFRISEKQETTKVVSTISASRWVDSNTGLFSRVTFDSEEMGLIADPAHCWKLFSWHDLWHLLKTCQQGNYFFQLSKVFLTWNEQLQLQVLHSFVLCLWHSKLFYSVQDSPGLQVLHSYCSWAKLGMYVCMYVFITDS